MMKALPKHAEAARKSATKAPPYEPPDYAKMVKSHTKRKKK
jgi:hypothetical protein